MRSSRRACESSIWIRYGEFCPSRIFFSLSQDFSKEKELLEGKIAETNRRLEELDARIAAGDNRRELVQRYTNLEHLTREMVEALIDYILVGKRQPGENDPPVEIHWNF